MVPNAGANAVKISECAKSTLKFMLHPTGMDDFSRILRDVCAKDIELFGYE